MAQIPFLSLPSVASVLSFVPPGLLLLATSVQLHEIPVNQTASLLKGWRARIAAATGSLPDEATKLRAASIPERDSFLIALDQAIDRRSRAGSNATESLVLMEVQLDQLAKALRKLQHLLGTMIAKTLMSLLACAGIILTLDVLGRLADPVTSESLAAPGDHDHLLIATAFAASAIMTAVAMHPLSKIRSTCTELDIRSNGLGNLWIAWLKGQRLPATSRRAGIDFECASTRMPMDSFPERMALVEKKIGQCERRVLIYELLGLLPAMTLYVLGRFMG